MPGKPDRMRMILRLAPWLAFAFVRLSAAPDATFDAVRQADDVRVAATIAADRGKLDEVLSADMAYSHSSGALDDKASFTDAIVSGRLKYLSLDYVDRKFVLASPGIVLMSGHCRVKVSRSPTSANVLNLSFLAVWRNEDGAWRFLAWHSSRMPDPATSPAPAPPKS